MTNLNNNSPKPFSNSSSKVQRLITLAKLRTKAAKEKLPLDHYTKEFLLHESLSLLSSPTVRLSLPREASNLLKGKEVANLESKIPQESILNPEQSRALSLALSGQSFVLVGAAGTGKTFTVKYILESLISNNKLPFMLEKTKNLEKGDYGFLACAPTRRATNVVRKQLPEGLKACTGHALIEYEPEFYSEIDSATGNLINKMRFIATRTAQTPLPDSLRFLVLDESSMLSLDFHSEIMAALPHKPQIIYIGDLAQLKPVFGDAILGYKLNELPVVELTQVYRQKEGEILDFITDVRLGNEIPDFTIETYNNPRLKITTFKAPAHASLRTAQMGGELQRQIDSGNLDPINGDYILCPFNVGLGTIELNNYVADYYDQKLNRQIIPIIAGMKTSYYAIGDKILIDRNDAIITDIKPNPGYIGRIPQSPSHKLSRWGVPRRDTFKDKSLVSEAYDEDAEFENELENLSLFGSDVDIETLAADAEKVRLEASHIISYRFLDPSEEQIKDSLTNPDSYTFTAKSAGDINKMELAYCISIHKSQGSQANHVMVILAKQHSTMLCRELLYTAASRAQNRLTIFQDSGIINKCIRNARIKGDSLEAKKEYFLNRSRDKEMQE
jgi:hypothetical protein